MTARPPALVDPEDKDPIALWVNFSRVLIAGHSSTLEVRVENRESAALENVELTLESRAFGSPTVVRVRRTPAGGQSKLMLEIDPIRAGNFVLQIGVRWDADGQRYAYRGQRPLRINQAPDNSNIVINISDIQSNAGTGANAGLGAEYGEVNISNLLGTNSIKTLNDLLDLELPEKFQRVPLALDYELSMAAIRQSTPSAAKPLQIPSGLLSTVQPGLSCTFEPCDGVEQPLPIRLIARSTFKIGRARADADFIAWILPRNETSDERTLRVSKVHVIAEARGTGLTVRDNESANGTMLDGQKLGPENVAIAARARLVLGGAVEVDITHFDAVRAEAPPIRNLRQWNGPNAAAPLQRGAVRCEVASEELQPLNSVWLLTDAAFGSSHSNALTFKWDEVAEIQGRFHYLNGCFWIENSAANGIVKVDTVRLQPGEIAPLATGQRLQIGNRTFRLSVAA